ncbi:MAG: HPr(Ser) kinase/phosphatase [Deltaproteobacteria bacterium]|nr:HPr(Ser) kinase/phosphatase [Deltaproteobacteria bacterium]
MSGFTVKELLEDKRYDLRLEILAGSKGLENEISSPKVQKPGLALSGFTDHLHGDRIQVLGNTEMSYLESLPRGGRQAPVECLFALKVCCFVITFGLEPLEELIMLAEKTGTPLLRTSLPTDKFTTNILNLLEERLTETTSIHGVLVDVLGIGMLIRGKSGVGKSECALDLIAKGHRLVADDMVVVTKRPPNIIIGSSPDLIRYHMEIRGLGIINIKDIFGNTAVRVEKQIDMVVQLVKWESNREYERLGFDQETYGILDVELPNVTLPVSSGRNMTTIIEVAARNHILRIMGRNPTLEFEKSLKEEILNK